MVWPDVVKLGDSQEMAFLIPRLVCYPHSHKDQDSELYFGHVFTICVRKYVE